MIVRELLAVFGIDFKDRGLKQAERGLSGLKRQTEGLVALMSTGFTAGLIAAPVVALGKMASDVQEGLNLLQLSFGDSSASVRDWARETSSEVGRSQSSLVDYVSQLGSIIKPMTGSAETAAELSTELTKRAVDLSSAYHTSVQQAIEAVVGGLTDQTRALKKYGVVMSQEALNAFALEKGYKGTFKALSDAEKTQVRSLFILEKSTLAAGDAANTLDSLANSAKAAKDFLVDVGQEVGLFLAPAMESILKDFRGFILAVGKGAHEFAEFAKGSNLAKAALYILGGVLASVLLPMLATIIPLAAGFAALVVVLDDVITTFEGGNSVLGLFNEILDEMRTPEALAEMSTAMKVLLSIVTGVQQAMGALIALMSSGFSGLLSGDFGEFMATLREVGDFYGKLLGLDKLGDKVLGVADQRSVSRAQAAVAATAGARGGSLLGGAPPTLLARPESQIGPRSYQPTTTLSINVSQSPGENQGEFVQRIKGVVVDTLEERDRGIVEALVPRAAGAQ